jgi:hypothetical protein
MYICPMRNPLVAATAVVFGAALAVALTRPNELRAGGVKTFVSAEPMVSPSGPGAGEPHLSVGPDRKVFLSWLEPADSGHALRVSALERTGWSAPRTVRVGRDFFVNWADFPSVLALGGGRLAAHWLQRTGTQTYAYGVRIAFSRDGGQSWSAPITPHTDSSSVEHGFVSLWRTGESVEAVWLDGRKYNPSGSRSLTNEMALATAGFRTDGRRSSPETILDGRVCDCCQTGVAMTSAGPVVVYRDRSPNEIRDMYIVRREDLVKGMARRWTEPMPVHNDGWKISACPVNGPSVDAKDRDVAVAWFTAANDTPRVRLAFSRDAGATFAAPVQVDGGQPAGRVDVVMTPEHDALVSWVERVGGDTAAVRVRRVTRDGRVGAPVTIAASSAARASGFPRMVIAGDDAIFAWTVPGRPSQVRVARLPLASIR